LNLYQKIIAKTLAMDKFCKSLNFFRLIIKSG
jgi:hypothetical protein